MADKAAVVKVVFTFPATAANAPVTPFVTVAFCQAIVPVALVNVSVVVAPLQTVVATAESDPTAVGWFTVTATAALATDEHAPLVATTLYHVLAVGDAL